MNGRLQKPHATNGLGAQMEDACLEPPSFRPRPGRATRPPHGVARVSYLSCARSLALIWKADTSGHRRTQRDQRSMGGAKYLAKVWLLRTESPESPGIAVFHPQSAECRLTRWLPRTRSRKQNVPDPLGLGFSCLAGCCGDFLRLPIQQPTHEAGLSGRTLGERRST